MKKTPILVLVMALAFTIVHSAAAQTPLPQDIFFTVNVGLQPSARVFEISASPTVYGENALINSLEGVDGAPMLDLLAGYELRRRFWVTLGVTTTMATNSEAFVVSQIPNPIFYDRPAVREASLTDLKHTERSAHVSIMWTTPLRDRIEAAVLAGPSYIKVFQDLVQTVEVLPGTQNATPIAEQATATMVGFHIGGNATYELTRTLGVGIMARFVRASAELPSVPDLKVGGFQYGIGLRVRF